MSTEKSDGKIRRYMVEHSWRYLKELSYLYIEPKIKNIKDDVSADDMLSYKDFALFTIKVFQDLIKESFDKNDFKSFSEFFGEFSSVYKNIKDHEYPNSAHLTASLSRITDPEEKNRVEDKINKLKNKEDAIKNILLAKKQVTFAIVSKIFDVYKRNPGNDDVKKFFELVNQNFNLSIKELTSVFDSIRNFEVEDFWGWDNWEIVADGEVHSIDVSSKFDYYYCIKILTLIKNKTDDQIKAIDLPHSRNLAFLAEERDGTLVSKLNEIKNTPTNWEWIIDSQSISKIDKFIELLNTAKEAQEHDEEEYLKTAEIDDEKLKEFKNKTVDGFRKSLKMRPLVELYKAYKDKTLEGPNQAISSYGYNQVYKKDAFIKDWHVSHGGLGEQYGSGMANSEDLIFFKTIVDGLNNKIDVAKDKLIEAIREKIDEHSFDNPIIIQSLDYMVEYDSIKNSDYFIDKWKSDCPKTKISQLDGFLGVFKFGSKVVPIFDMFFREDGFNNKVAIIDLKELGVWEQYLPIDQAGDEQYVDDLLYIRVIDLNLDEEKRDKMIEDNPSWLQDESDKEGYLRQMVNIKIYEKFRFLMKDQPLGTIVSVTNVVEE